MSVPSLPLPQRNLVLSPNPLRIPRAFWFSVIVLAALLGAMCWWQGPGLIRDVQINANPVLPDAVKTIDGECTMRRGLTTCDAKLIYNVDGKAYNSDVSMAFVDIHSGDYMVEVVVSGDKPELATLSLGLDMLWNRLAVFGVFALLFGGGLLATLVTALGAVRANRGFAQPARLSIVPVEVTLSQSQGKGTYVTYAEKLEKRRSRHAANTWFGAGVAPLMTTLDDGTVVGLAAKHPMSALPVLLDDGLTRLADLSEPERRAMLEALPVPSQEALMRAGEKAPKKLHWARGILAFFVVVLLAIAAIAAYWLYYVTSAETQFDSIGMEINAILPEPLNVWGCAQLEARFGDDRAPFGCTTGDHVSWK